MLIKTMKLIKTTIIVLVAIISTSTVFSQNNTKIAIGPYVQNVTGESAVVCWATLDGKSSYAGPDGKIQFINRYNHHEMLIPNLKPNTEYSYDIFGNSDSAGCGTFRTFPEKRVTFKFAVIGDTRSRPKVHASHIKSIIEENPLFVLNTGDLVGNGLKIENWETFFNLNRELMQTIPYFTAIGNHEKDAEYYYDFFNLPGNERYYAFSVGDALFIALDTEGVDYQTPDYIKKENREYFWTNHELPYFIKQKEWLKHTLDLHKDAGFIFVYFHQPLFSVKKSRVEETKMRRAFWGDIFEHNNVQAVFNGHDHHYHHALSGETHYITTAGGGAGLYEIDAMQPETVTAKQIEHYLIVEVDKKEAKISAIDIHGKIIEDIIVQKRSGE